MKVFPEIGEFSVSNYLWDCKTESKISRQFLIKSPKRMGISLCQYPPLIFSKSCLTCLPFPLVLLPPLVVWNCYS